MELFIGSAKLFNGCVG